MHKLRADKMGEWGLLAGVGRVSSGSQEHKADALFNVRKFTQTGTAPFIGSGAWRDKAISALQAPFDRDALHPCRLELNGKHPVS